MPGISIPCLKPQKPKTAKLIFSVLQKVHSFMYSYYAFRALRFKIPKMVNIVITSLQLSQMLIGIAVNTVAYLAKNNGERCDVTYDNIYWSFFMYFTYFVLFFHFFVNAYLKKPKSASAIASRNGQVLLKKDD
jgi:elongation of very long chain fatty acids protein 6